MSGGGEAHSEHHVCRETAASRIATPGRCSFTSLAPKLYMYKLYMRVGWDIPLLFIFGGLYSLKLYGHLLPKKCLKDSLFLTL